MSIDPNVKGAISESFDKSHLSDSFDVPAGCRYPRQMLTDQETLRIMKDLQDGMEGMESASHDRYTFTFVSARPVSLIYGSQHGDDHDFARHDDYSQEVSFKAAGDCYSHRELHMIC